MHIVRIVYVLFTFYRILFGTTQHCHNETGRCYWLGTGSASWGDARTACQSQGGDLAVIETEELYDYVLSKFRYFSSQFSPADLMGFY